MILQMEKLQLQPKNRVDQMEAMAGTLETLRSQLLIRMQNRILHKANKKNKIEIALQAATTTEQMTKTSKMRITKICRVSSHSKASYPKRLLMC